MAETFRELVVAQGQKLTQQQRAVEQYSRALVAANDKLRENYDRHQDYSERLE